MRKNYYVFYNSETQKHEVIDCTHHQNQPVVKSFKYETSAYKFMSKLKSAIN